MSRSLRNSSKTRKPSTLDRIVPIQNHTGSKYLRQIPSAIDPSQFVEADVYAVLVGFNVHCPGRQHAIKKLLCAGLRDKGDQLQDLLEARDALDRAIQLQAAQSIRRRSRKIKR